MATSRARKQEWLAEEVEALSLSPYRQSLPLALLRARESVMSRIRPVLRAHDVTEQQWRVLRTLNEVGEVEVSALAELVCLLPSSLSRILRDLAERKLILRRTPRVDLRRGLVRIAPDGLELIRQVAPKAAIINARIQEQFGEPRMGRLKQLLAELLTSLDDLNDLAAEIDDKEPTG